MPGACSRGHGGRAARRVRGEGIRVAILNSPRRINFYTWFFYLVITRIESIVKVSVGIRSFYEKIGGIGMRLRAILPAAAGLLLAVSCATAPTVTRTSADEVIDLSGRWNDTDARLTAEAMVSSMLSGGWLAKFISSESREPVVIVGTISNRSSEHIDAITFVKAIERELINSGQVVFVAGGEERNEIREEREDQQSSATMATAAALAAETGADYMMQGVITSQTDAIDGKRATLYKVDMELVDLETNQKVWIDTKEIKKLVEQKKASW
jgi:uncharacterized protein (TIGR02722 family)